MTIGTGPHRSSAVRFLEDIGVLLSRNDVPSRSSSCGWLPGRPRSAPLRR